MILQKRWQIRQAIYMESSMPRTASDIDQAMEMVNRDAGTEVATTEYSNLNEEAGALLDGSVQAIVYNEGYGGILEEVYEDFQSQIKIIAQYSIESNTDSAVLGKAEEVNVEDETFNIISAELMSMVR